MQTEITSGKVLSSAILLRLSISSMQWGQLVARTNMICLPTDKSLWEKSLRTKGSKPSFTGPVIAVLMRSSNGPAVIGNKRPARSAVAVKISFMKKGHFLNDLLNFNATIRAAKKIKSSSIACLGVRFIHEPKHPQSSVTPVTHAYPVAPMNIKNNKPAAGTAIFGWKFITRAVPRQHSKATSPQAEKVTNNGLVTI